ncbi:hypothetical protein SAV14893_086640 [Streptomyces avermitilis]|uniref:Insertion element IS402-like domain-containing protein n=1 Tax=Streptomyces avermitilis TaxID=33903 RepID=A0A4D4MBG7_STRAX|nr:hypothetical protein SAVMC3_09920 [Streptomyces avermitilis]GDY69271.1 hypothetical protein SAV14893_086640 [Streptomyces avermitilis]GDY88239.1 hypothetical protein SAVCW2_74380 [Streptomyces avermitilis]
MPPLAPAFRPPGGQGGLDIGRPPQHDPRGLMDAILYVDRTGIPWRHLPRDFAPRETVYGHFAAWQKDGIFNQLNGPLSQLEREAAGRDVEPQFRAPQFRAPGSVPPGSMRSAAEMNEQIRAPWLRAGGTRRAVRRWRD